MDICMVDGRTAAPLYLACRAQFVPCIPASATALLSALCSEGDGAKMVMGSGVSVEKAKHTDTSPILYDACRSANAAVQC
jgi:hypothetical protein